MQLEDLSFVTAVTGRPLVQSLYWLTGLHANALLALSISCCFFRFGRMPTYLISTVAFIGATLGCVFAPTAPVLVLFRALQGAGGTSRGRQRGRERGREGPHVVHFDSLRPPQCASFWPGAAWSSRRAVVGQIGRSGARVATMHAVVVCWYFPSAAVRILTMGADMLHPDL